MSEHDRNASKNLNEDIPSTSAGSGQIEGMGVGSHAEPGAKKLGYKKNNQSTTLKQLKHDITNTKSS